MTRKPREEDTADCQVGAEPSPESDAKPSERDEPEDSEPTGKYTAESVAANSVPHIDLSAVNRTLSTSLVETSYFSTATESSSSEHDQTSTLEELQEDVLDLMNKVNALQRHQELIGAELEKLTKTVAQASHTHGRELYVTRTELLAERKSFAAISAFNAIVQPLDQLRQMRTGLDSDKDVRTIAQLDGIIEVLAQVLRSLGFSDFVPREGEPFDPARMEVVGFTDGPSGVVLKAVRVGYRTGDAMVRVAGVMIAQPGDI